MPSEAQAENSLLSKQFLKDDLVVSLAGRIAEELLLGTCSETTGAVGDIQGATALARRMVTIFGLSESIGPMMLEDPSQHATWLSQARPELKNEVDLAIKTLIAEAEIRCRAILTKNKPILAAVATVLARRGRIEGDAFRELVAQLQKLTFHSDL